MSLRKRFRVTLRELFIRLRAFRGFLLGFFVITTIAAIVIRYEYTLPFLHSYYEAVTLLFYAADLEYPDKRPLLELFFLIYPLLGLFIIIDGLNGIGESLKLGDPTSEIYNTEMAALMDEHVIIVGIGHLGNRVVDRLKTTNEDIVVIDKSDNTLHDDILEEFQREYWIPVIKGDATLTSTLEAANLRSARTMLILIDNDLLNLKIAIRARRINPHIKLIIRFFDQQLGKSIAERLNASILSTTMISTPSFVGRLKQRQQQSLSSSDDRTDHIIIVGLGNLGVRIVNELKDKETLVMIDMEAHHSLLDVIDFHEYDMPLIKGDATKEQVLLDADIETARALVITTGSDLTNLKNATVARRLNPDIQLIMRMYDDPLSEDTTGLLDAAVLSTTKIAVKEFLANL